MQASIYPQINITQKRSISQRLLFHNSGDLIEPSVPDVSHKET